MPMPDLRRRDFALGAVAASGALLLGPTLRAAAPPDATAERRCADDGRRRADQRRRARSRRVGRAQALMRRLGFGVDPDRARRVARPISPASNGTAASGSPPPSSRPRARPSSSRPSSRSPRSARASPSRPRSAPGRRTRIRCELVAGALRDRRLAARPVGIEETVRFFAVDGLRKALPHVEIRNAAPVVRGVPDDQVRARARADAEGDRHHHRRLSLHLAADRARA